MSHVIPDNVVVVGTGVAGLRTVEQLRSRGYQGAVTMVGKETVLPYDRPPLSKQLLTGTWAEDRVTLRSRAELAALEVDLRLGVEATGLGIWTVALDDGTQLRADATVIATGAVPRTILGQADGVSTLRTLADARALKEKLAVIKTLLIVGGGFIAAEVATAAVAAGVAVTVVEALEGPCERVLGAQVAPLVARLFGDSGVDLRTGSRIERFLDATTVELAGGEQIRADHILVSIGSVPDVEWLAGTVPIGDGILAGGTGRVSPLPEVWALGDATSWWDQPRRRHARSEHWTSANDQAAMVVADILGLDTPDPPPPYIWSDQFGLKVQLLGRPDIADEVVQLEGEGLGGGPVKGTVVGYRKDGHLIGVAAFGAPAKFVGYRAAVVAGTKAITTVAVAIGDD